MILTPMTKLEAINEIIGTLGEAPVNTLVEPENVDVMNAIRMLESVTTSILARGWTFNTLRNYAMVPDSNTKRIHWNNNILQMSLSDKRVMRNRGGLLYDVTNNTEEFDATVEAEVIVLVPFEELPQAFRNYITIRTSRLFNARYLGDEVMLRELQQEESQAYMEAMEYEIGLEKNSMLSNPVIMDYMNRG